MFKVYSKNAILTIAEFSLTLVGIFLHLRNSRKSLAWLSCLSVCLYTTVGQFGYTFFTNIYI